MQASGMIKGLSHEYGDPIQYYLALGEGTLPLNQVLGEALRLQFTGEIECVYCGRKIKKTYNHGSCYVCFKKRPENDLCIVKPSLCHFEEGTCRDAAFGEQHCMIPHYVYLAVSSDVKVGLTRKNNELKRWADQGAIKAIPIAEVPNRKTAGELEEALADYLPDKTNWRKMLKGEINDVDLKQVRDEVLRLVPESFRHYILTEEEIVQLTYPVLEEVGQIKSYNLDKQPQIEDRLIGIKGQYLLFAGGVINIKKYCGYHVHVKVV
ncbi:hypothetical protein GCM10010965_26600 [Caldalkalibacillus thermarum]|uniref:DUF2797 domain-containing protein n=1 Tax=Caldalkalibacillus thermarum TaxID=296745 RepID=UPI001663EB29|nr:DUF2797 domain-containing protein [Caldalkalibacillus thermarum]GGK32381.1 hypothetical protein GCM10010965_26600 [Caldalkalibacillus thermarum]